MATMKMHRSTSVWAWIVIALATTFFAVPIIAMARFAFQRVPVALLGRDTLLKRWTFDGLIQMFKDPEFVPALWLSVRIALLTVALTLVLMVPTALWVNTKAKRFRSVVEISTMLPYVVPAIALVVGAGGAFRDVAPWFLRSDFSLIPFYVILAMPFTYRTIDAGLHSIDLPTLLNAARSLGASNMRAVVSVVLPNMRSSLWGAAFLTMSVVLGEFTIASLLLKPTLPLYMSYSQGSNPQGALGLAVVMLLLTSLLFFMMARLSRRRPQSRSAEDAR